MATLDGRGYSRELLLAEQIQRELRRKQRICARSPQIFSSMDADEYDGASAAELATRELKELGITPKNSDPVELLDAHHAGRDYARQQGVGSATDGRRRVGAARDRGEWHVHG